MKRRILAALSVLLGEPIPHEWTDCPRNSNILTYEFDIPPVDTQTWAFVNDWGKEKI